MFSEASEEGLCFSASCFNVRIRFPGSCLEINTYSRCEISLRCLLAIMVFIFAHAFTCFYTHAFTGSAYVVENPETMKVQSDAYRR